jgi:cytosine/adenosine deaminase-related metal-dependent hydrolase
MMRTLFLLLCLYIASVSKAETSSTLFKNVKVFDGKSNQQSQVTNVLVTQNLIAGVDANLASLAVPNDVLIVDGKGRTLMPGLIDNHVHIFMNGSTQMDMLSSVDKPDALHDVAAAMAEKMLMRGFTSVRDMGGPVFEVKRSIDSGKSIGPRIYPSGALISQTSGHGDTRLPDENSIARMNVELWSQVAEANIQVGIRKQQVDMAQTAIARARDSYQRNIDRIRDGQGLPIVVLQAIQALEASERAYLRALADYNRSQLQLQWALGWPVNALPTSESGVLGE